MAVGAVDDVLCVDFPALRSNSERILGQPGGNYGLDGSIGLQGEIRISFCICQMGCHPSNESVWPQGTRRASHASYRIDCPESLNRMFTGMSV